MVRRHDRGRRVDRREGAGGAESWSTIGLGGAGPVRIGVGLLPARGAFAKALVAGMEPRELPPVLVAIEEMTADPSTTLDSRT